MGIRLHSSTIKQMEVISFPNIQLSLILTEGNIVSLNIYGPRKYMFFIARQLNGVGITLEHPHTVRDGVQYQNAQWRHNPYTKESMNHHVKFDGREIMIWSPSGVYQAQNAKNTYKAFFLRMLKF